jgi:hypothetical protein
MKLSTVKRYLGVLAILFATVFSACSPVFGDKLDRSANAPVDQHSMLILQADGGAPPPPPIPPPPTQKTASASLA